MHGGAEVRHLDEWFDHDVNLDFVLHEPAYVVGTVEAAGLLDIGHPRGPRRATLVNTPGDPGEVIADRAPALANVIEELVPAALHNTGQYENNRVECDHGRLKATAQADARTEAPSNGERRDPRTRLCPEPVVATTSWQSTPHRCSSLATAFDELTPAI